MKRVVTSNPLLLGVLSAVVLVWAGGRAMLGRHEGRLSEGIVGGDASVVLSADPAEVRRPGDELTGRIDRREAGEALGVWVHGHVTSKAAAHPGTLSFRAAGETDARSTSVQEDGFYELLLDSSGPHAITFAPEANDGLPESVALSATIPAESEHALNLTLPPGTVRGRVLSLDDDPIAGALVSLHEGPLGEEAPTSDPLATATTDAEGRFAFVLLGEGTYNVFARSRNARRFARREVELNAAEAQPQVELRWPR